MAIAFDIGNPEAIAHELEQANRTLAHEQDVPHSVSRLVHDVADAVIDADREAIAEVDPELWDLLRKSAERARDVSLEDESKEHRRDMRLAIERLRFLLARLSERVPQREARPVEEVVRWLAAVLAQDKIEVGTQAAIVGVDEDTYTSWLSETDPAVPSGSSERRVRLTGQVISELLHTMSPAAAVEWLTVPRSDLLGQAPLALIADEREAELLARAALLRSPTAS